MVANSDYFVPNNSEIITQNLTSEKDDLKIEKKNYKWYEFETKISPKYFAIVTFQQIMLVYYGITFPYREHPILVAWGLFMTYVSVFGVTAGIHRFWSHRSFKATLPIRILLALCFYSAGQMSIRRWSRQHRIHHKYTDTDGDPHNSRRGLFFSHLGWLVLEEKPEVEKCRQQVNIDDVLSDSVVQFFDDYYSIMHILCIGVIPSFIPWYFFNQDLKWAIISQVFIRYPLAIHCISSINSFAHTFGYRTYDKHIFPTENFFVSLAAMGEGWHNYHHAFPWDYRASEFSNFFFNPTTSVLNLFAKLGLIYDLKYASKDHIEKVIKRKGDGGTDSDKYKYIDQLLS